MRAIEIAAVIEEFAPIALQEGWDNCGFSIGDREQEVTSVLLGLDFTEELLKEAIEIGANMVITHHPLTISGVKKITPDNYIGRIIEMAIKNSIVLYSAHTNADKVIGGVSGLMADRLNLKDIKFLDEGGLGIVGELDTPCDANRFIEIVKERFNLKVVKSSKVDNTQKIKRVALCGGSGKSLINRSIEVEADVYISGDISYHDFFCEKGFLLLDIGHYESEIDILKCFLSILMKKIPNFAVTITNKNNNPIYYY